MDLVFNELSIQPLAKDISEAGIRLHQYFGTIKKLQNHGFKRVRYIHSFDDIKLTSDHSFTSFCQISSNSLRTITTLLLGLARHPFIDENSKEEERYIKNEFYISKEDKLLEAIGLGTAYLYNTVAVSFNSEKYWQGVIFPLIIKGEEEKETPIFALCFENHCEDERFRRWKDNNSPIELDECEIPHQKKAINLRDDHGKDVLKAFAKRLRMSPYVVKIVNSLPYNPGDKEFIKKITADGLIEMVLISTDKGLGMVVKTTGRNLRETEEIARILKDKYSE